MSRLSLPRQTQVTVVCSGDTRTFERAGKALVRAGFALVVLKRPEASWGLPSYTDPVVAHAAGHPNSGHTPGTAHPARLVHLADGGGTERREHSCPHVGEPYQDDPRVGFLTATAACPDRPGDIGAAVTKAQRAAEKEHWQVRLHWARQPQVSVHDPDTGLSTAQRIARVERDLKILKGAS